MFERQAWLFGHFTEHPGDCKKSPSFRRRESEVWALEILEFFKCRIFVTLGFSNFGFLSKQSTCLKFVLFWFDYWLSCWAVLKQGCWEWEETALVLSLVNYLLSWDEQLWIFSACSQHFWAETILVSLWKIKIRTEMKAEGPTKCDSFCCSGVVKNNDTRADFRQ